MDKFERYMSRARACRRAGRAQPSALWGFESWASDRRESHHVARKKYGDATLDIPVSMHRELTRRQMEEHPEEGPDSSNPTERLGRHLLGLSDIFECFADFFRYLGETLITAAKNGAASSGR
ncbi:hypothetical protein [Microvirga antarctica]|uniref:hypothetical protein n=1 Tax=Microvirga antarctica TaxID=2819233 RepID=UPI001B3021B4|nr:hypothetical protein [Microvirga antarctica]